MIELSQRVFRAGLLALIIAGAACIFVNERSDREDDLARPTSGALAADSSEDEGRAENLEQQRDVILRRIAAKARTVEDVIDGRLTLREAARRFRKAHGTHPIVIHPSVVAAFRKERGGVADEAEALLCLDVIQRVDIALTARAARTGGVNEAETIRQRLQAQLRVILATATPQSNR